jgi:hypothetical protein
MTWVSGGIAQTILTLALDEGVWVSPRVGLDAVDNIKIVHCKESNTSRPNKHIPFLVQMLVPSFLHSLNSALDTEGNMCMC